MLTHSRLSILLSGLAFFIIGVVASTAYSLNFTKIIYTAQTSDSNGVVNAGYADLGPNGAPPDYAISNGLGNKPTPYGVADTRPFITNLGSGGQDGVGITFNDGGSPPNFTTPGTTANLDVFEAISLPDTAGNPTGNPSSMVVVDTNKIGNSGISIDLLLQDPATGQFSVPLNVTLSVPQGQGLSFDSITPSFTSAGSTGTFSSFFDVFTELDVTGPVNSSAPLFDLSESTPEPASLSLLALAIPLLIKRRRIHATG